MTGKAGAFKLTGVMGSLLLLLLLAVPSYPAQAKTTIVAQAQPTVSPATPPAEVSIVQSDPQISPHPWLDDGNKVAAISLVPVVIVGLLMFIQNNRRKRRSRL